MSIFWTMLATHWAAALIGFAIGWRARALASSRRMTDERRDVQFLRSALSEAQVRRARIS